MKKFWAILLALALVSLSAGCGEEMGQPAESEFGIAGNELDENGKPVLGTTGWEEPAGKADALQGKRGLPVSVDGDSLSVWEVKNQWADTDTAAAREAGVAWEANSGLDWDQKYVRWIEKMQKIDAESYGQTFELLTPWGKSLPAPAIECAETAIFLRITFASWYKLPFFLEARDSGGKRLYFGHFGMRTEDGRYGRTPHYRDAYKDYTDQADQIREGAVEWPRDSVLAGRQLYGSFDDEQPMIGPDAHLGAYLDEIYLNKRVGYFMMITLPYFGSINLVDPVNTYNVRPEATQAGDVLLERWQARGIGHTLVVIRTSDLGTQEVDGEEVPLLEASLISGSMPRRQPRWDSPAASKRYFTDERTGGEGYAELGGGLKRWRAATQVNGRWTNVVLPRDADDYMNSRNKEELATRPERFDQVLSELSPQQKMDALYEIVEAKRQHLRNYPASCSARIGREDAFRDMYETAKANFDMTPAEVDKQYRSLEDYVFAELEYTQSKTCCWNSSTADMYQIVMDLAEMTAQDPETGECREVTVFMNYDDESDGFQIFRDFAEATGRGDQWVAWRADESCPQADVAQDTQATHSWAPMCDIADALFTEDGQ